MREFPVQHIKNASNRGPESLTDPYLFGLNVTYKNGQGQNTKATDENGTAGKQSKAALIGRNRRRFLEMQKIIADYFVKELLNK